MNKELKTTIRGAVLSPIRTISTLKSGISIRSAKPFLNQTTVAATHHKVLTVYMARIFRAYAIVTGQTFSMGNRTEAVDYNKKVLLSQHGNIDFNQITDQYRGIHIRRDPRDVLVSCVLYHLKSSERWLHIPGSFGIDEMTYQQKLQSIPTMKDRLLFEIDHAAGRCINQMQSWSYSNESIAEFKYEDLMTEEAPEQFADQLSKVGFAKNECELLKNLFVLFSSRGKLANRKHIRNPRTQQWKEHFTPEIETIFSDRFGNILEQLKYK